MWCVLPLALWVGVLCGGMLLQWCCIVARVPKPRLQPAASSFALPWFIYLFVQFINSMSLRVALGPGVWLIDPPGFAVIWTLSLLVTLAWSGAIAAFIYYWRLSIPLGKGVLIWALQTAVLVALYFALGWALRHLMLDV